jgi:long-chain fatty acid transport protein
MSCLMMRRLGVGLCAAGLLCIASQAMASAFQLWEQDGASVGNYHAGYAALANDASTAWYNPAGIVRIKNQQAVFGADTVLSSFKYKGNITVVAPPFPPALSGTPVTSQGGTFNVIPYLHYVAPLNDRAGFGFSIDVPFGLKTDYGRSTVLRYAATLTSIKVIDISPSFGILVTDKASLGVGFDIQRVYAEFDSIATVINPDAFNADTTSTNTANGTGYGYHLGALYQFTPETRAGISYHSQVAHHLSGSSRFQGLLADPAFFNPNAETGSHATTSFRLPAYTALSVYHKLVPQVGLMGSVIYTQWDVFKNLVLKNVAGPADQPPVEVTVPQNYRNSWNLSVGADYYATDRITLRGGVGYDQTPVINGYRNVQLPDNNRYVVAVGGHYQATKTVGLDLGWTHLFFPNAHVAPPTQVVGSEQVTTNGQVTGGADVFGAQVTWDLT